MERTRNISLSLILLSLLLGLSARNIVSFSSKDYIFLAIIILIPHVIGFLVTNRKVLQNIAPLISALLGLELLLFAAGNYQVSKALPSLSNLQNLAKLSRNGLEQFKSQSVPLEKSIGILIVFGFIFWAVAELMETLSRRLHLYGTTFGVYILFFTISTSVTKNHFETIVVIPVCIVSWLYLRSTYKTKISSSGHHIPVDSKNRILGIIRNFALLTTVIAVCVVLVFPISHLSHFAPKNWLERVVGNNDSSTTELSPLVSMRAQLKGNTNELMFTAQADSARYFRVGVLNKFDGETWSYDSERDVKEPKIEGRDTIDATATFNLAKLDPKFLPTIYQTKDTSDRSIQILKNSTLFSPSGDVRTYSVDASIPSDVISSQQEAASSTPSPIELDNYLLIPEDFDPDIENLARSIASNKSSIYEQIIALRDYFTAGDFTYSIDVDYTSSQDSMKDFLDKKIGFCEQFAATYAAMARSIRIPSRVVIGFSPGQADANGVFNVTAKQAHSWVEVYLTDVGWVTIDPTPQGNLPGQAPTNIGESVSTTSTTTTIAQASSSVPVNSEVTSTTLAKSEVKPIEQKAKSSDNTILILASIIAVLVLASGTSYFVFRKKKKTKATQPISWRINSIYRNVVQAFLSSHNKDLTIAEAKMSVPNEYIKTQKFLDQYSDFTYSPDSDIDIEELMETGRLALEEIEIENKEKVKS